MFCRRKAILLPPFGRESDPHNRKGIPDYLKTFVERREEDLSWFEREMRLTDIGGIGVIDLRRKE